MESFTTKTTNSNPMHSLNFATVFNCDRKFCWAPAFQTWSCAWKIQYLESIQGEPTKWSIFCAECPPDRYANFVRVICGLRVAHSYLFRAILLRWQVKRTTIHVALECCPLLTHSYVCGFSSTSRKRQKLEPFFSGVQFFLENVRIPVGIYNLRIFNLSK